MSLDFRRPSSKAWEGCNSKTESLSLFCGSAIEKCKRPYQWRLTETHNLEVIKTWRDVKIKLVDVV